MLVGFSGPLYRAFNPRWTAQPLSGEWAARFGGRFNRKGRPALYTVLEPGTALREVSRTKRMQPTLFVSYEASLVDVVDAAASGLDDAVLGADDWQRRMDAEGMAPSSSSPMNSPPRARKVSSCAATRRRPARPT